MSAEPRTLADLGRLLKSRALTAEAVTEGAWRESPSGIGRSTPSSPCSPTKRWRRRGSRPGDRCRRYRGPLHGVPISLKDIIDLRDAPTTAASRVRDGHIARRDATVVGRLRQAGAIFIGKTNLHEFALGTTNEDSAYGPVLHPLDGTRSPGGSSGGSAASVLAGMAYASIGTEPVGRFAFRRLPAAWSA